MARNTSWPDGEPRLGPNDNGNVGGNTRGHATRRVDGWSTSDTAALNWVPNTPVNPAGGAYQKIGPGSALWNKASRTKNL